MQSSSRRWHPITQTTASEMQLLPGSMWSRGRPGRRAPGLWGSPSQDCSWCHVSWPLACRWLGFKVVWAARGFRCCFCSCGEKWGELQVILGKKVCDLPLYPKRRVSESPGVR